MGFSAFSFDIIGIPMPKQSARFKQVGKKMISYQTKKIKDRAKSVAIQFKNQRPKGFKIIDQPFGIRYYFIYPPLKSWNKATRESFDSGERIWKQTRPDSDNLVKQIGDSLEGHLFTDDAKAVEVIARKFYGQVAMTKVRVYEV